MREGERRGGKVISEGEGERVDGGEYESGSGDVGRRSYLAGIVYTIQVVMGYRECKGNVTVAVRRTVQI